MSWSERRGFLLGGAALLAAGCGFQPMLREGGPAAALFGKVALPDAVDPPSFAFRERMRRRLGDADGGARYRLESALDIVEEGVAVTQASDITRFSVSGRVRWALVDKGDDSIAASGVTTAETRYDATAGAFATRAARLDAERRLAIELAERVAARLLSGAAT